MRQWAGHLSAEAAAKCRLGAQVSDGPKTIGASDAGMPPTARSRSGEYTVAANYMLEHGPPDRRQYLAGRERRFHFSRPAAGLRPDAGSECSVRE